MTNRIRTLVALEEGIAQDSITAVLPVDQELEVLAFVEGLESEDEAVARTSADLMLIACSPGSDAAVAFIRQAVAHGSDRAVVVLQHGFGTSNGFMHEVFAAGADDIITLPETSERVRHALHKAISRKRGALLGKGKTPAPLICVLGPKGGTGKTITTCNLAVIFAEQGRNAAVVDLDLHFGDVGLGLQLSPKRTIYDLARSGGTLDAEKLDGFLLSKMSGLRALLAPTRPDHAGAVSTAFIADVLALLRATCDVVVVDTPAGFPPEVITAIDGSTHICMVGMLDAFSLKDTKLGLETLELMGYDRGSIRLILNRADSHVGIGKKEVKAILGREPDVLVPSDRDIPLSVTEGIPIVMSQPRSDAAKAFRDLAGLYADEPAGMHLPPVEPSRRRKPLLRRA